MTPERWAEIKRMLDVLQTLDPQGRDVLLRDLDADLRRDLAEYLNVDSRLLGALPPTSTHDGVPEAQVLAGRYRLEHALGRGGMGTVHLAHDLVLDCPVAIKRLRDPWLDDGEARRRLRNEGRALAALNHPHIARVQDVLDTTPPALIMEFVDGLPLDRWLHQPRSPEAVFDVLRSLVEAVAYAHGRSVVHCDIKPANVLVTRDGVVKVVDFGIAQIRTRSAVTTFTSDSTRHPAYTPRYAAPEVVHGATPTPASDVYSLGVLIDEVVDTCGSVDHPLPEALAADLRRVARTARAEHASERQQDAAALLKQLPAASGVPARPARAWTALASTTLLVASACVSAAVTLRGDPLPTSAGLPVLGVVARVDASASSTPSAGAAELLRLGLGKLKRARLANGDVPALREDLPDLIKRLRDQGLSHVLVPTVAPFGSGVRMSVALLRAEDGVTLATFSRHGSRDAIGALALAVAQEVRDWLGESTAVGARTTLQFQPGAEAFALFSEAKQYSGRPDVSGALARAASLLEGAVRLEPEYAAAHAELGRVLLLQYQETPAPELVIRAQDALVEAQRQGAHMEDVLLALAMAKQMTGRRDEAIAYLHRVLDGNPDNEGALRALGGIEVAKGSVEPGLDLLRRATTLRPSYQNFRALGSALHAEGRYEEALIAFNRLAVLQSDNPWSFQMIGATHQAMGDDDLARAAYERSISARRTASTLTNFGTFLYRRGDLEQAERRYAEAVALEPYDPVFHRNLGDAQLQRGHIDAARATYGRAVVAAESLLRVNLGDVRTLGNAAYASARQGDCVAAKAYADRLATVAPTQVPALANRANAGAICGRHAESAAILTGLAARGQQPSSVLEKDVWASVSGLPEYRTLVPERYRCRQACHARLTWASGFGHK